MALFCAAIRRNSVTLFRFPFLSHVQLFSCEISLCRLKYPYSCFSFHAYFLVIVISLIIVLFLFAVIALFYVVFESSYRCIGPLLNACEPASSFFSCLCHLWDVKSYALSLVFLFSGSCSLSLSLSLLFCSFESFSHQRFSDGLLLESVQQQVSSSLFTVFWPISTML